VTESTYHDGELAVQKRAGVQAMAARIGHGIRTQIPRPAADFLSEQRFAVLGALADDGRMWASIVTGEPGFLSAIDVDTLRVSAAPSSDDPLADVWSRPAEVGLLAIDFAERRRMRINGNSRPAGRGLEIATEQVYANCPKYIQAREITPSAAPAAAGRRAVHSPALGPEASRIVSSADTFFVASAVPGLGADVSHRGGEPGFVTVVDDRTLLWPDYSGNTMFQTLGNIAKDGRTGLLFVDFTTGDVVQLTGTARILWDDPRIARTPGAERLVEFTVEHLVERVGAVPFQWRLVDRSPFNPR